MLMLFPKRFLRLLKGDDLTIENGSQPYYLKEIRGVSTVSSTNAVETVPYLSWKYSDENLLRPVVWTRQTEDKIINEEPYEG